LTGRPEPPPESAQEALARARLHARRALAESVAALRALLDAGSLAASGAPSAAHAGTRVVERGLAELESLLAGEGGPDLSAVIDALVGALDAEIARWEERGRDDPDARAVLRAFIGLREILWEFGLRPRGEPADAPGPQARRPPARPAPDALRRREPQPRVQRVPVEG
jgi:hypothetical protein